MVHSSPFKKVPIPSSTANMKVATTVFVGNISEKASDTLIRQILLVSNSQLKNWCMVLPIAALWSNRRMEACPRCNGETARSVFCTGEVGALKAFLVILNVGFGFCEYADPESTLRALRLLDKLKLGEKALVVSADSSFGASATSKIFPVG